VSRDVALYEVRSKSWSADRRRSPLLDVEPSPSSRLSMRLRTTGSQLGQRPANRGSSPEHRRAMLEAICRSESSQGGEPIG